MSIRKTVYLFGLCFGLLSSATWAATGMGGGGNSPYGNGNSSYYDSGSSHGHAAQIQQNMIVDVSVVYVRDTQASGPTDTAGKFSLGGNFNEWWGMDAQGLYQIHAKNYLVGADLRFMPIDWFFIKGGLGAYSEKTTNSLNMTPLAGAGIMAHVTRDYYILTETSYFSSDDHSNISFGVGLGFMF